MDARCGRRVWTHGLCRGRAVPCRVAMNARCGRMVCAVPCCVDVRCHGRAMAVPCHGRAVPCRAMASLLDDACCAWHLWIIQSFRVLLWSFTCPPMDNSIFPMTIRSSGERLLHAQSVPHCAKCRAVPNPCRAKSVPCRAVPSPCLPTTQRAMNCRCHLYPSNTAL